MDPLAELFLRYAARGDVGALGEVFDRTAPKLLHLAMHLAHTAEDAEDLLQATFVLAMRKAPAFDGKMPLLPWLSGILAGEARNLARRNAHRRADELPELAAGDGGPVDAAERRELVAQLREHVEALPGDQRQALLLQLQHGLSPASIAEVLDVPPGAVRMRLHRGLQALRKLLPMGLAVWLFGALGTRGLAAVRTAVVREAGALRTTVAGGASVVGGIVAMKYAACAVAVVLAAFLCWWFVTPSQPAPAPRDVQAGAPVVAAGSAPDAGNATPGERIAASAERNDERREAIGSLRVRVVTHDGDLPLRDVALRIWPGTDALPLHDPRNLFVRTDDSGLARFDTLAPGPWQLAAVGFDTTAPAKSAVVAAGAATEHVLEVRASALRGIVVDEHGAPVAGAAVRVGPGPGSGLYHAPSGGNTVRHDVLLRVAAISAADGTFAGAAGDDEAYVAASHPRYRSSLSQLTGALGIDYWRLVLAPQTTSLGGRVLDSKGRPLAGALVTASLHRGVERTRDGTWLGAQLPELTTTDAGGRFRLLSLCTGATNLLATAPGHVRGEGFARTAAGGDVDDVEIVLRPAVEITGTVRTADGAGLHHVTVAAMCAVPGIRQQAMLASAELRGDGRFAMAGVPAPPFDLVVRADATHVLLCHAVAATDERSLHVDLVLPARPTLRGRVVDHADRPLAHWVVVVRDDASRTEAWAEADERGEFAVQHVVGERVRVSTWPSPGANEFELTDVSPLGGEVVLRVPADRLPRASVAGRLVDHTGQPITGATVLLAVEQRARLDDVTAADGSFRIRAVSPGTYDLLLRTEGQRPRTLTNVTLAAEQALELGNLRVAPLATLHVDLVLADGTPWRGMLPDVYVKRDGRDGSDWLPKLGPGALEGAVEPGSVRIEVTDPDLIAQAQDVELLPGERRAVRLAVAIGRSIDLVFAGDGHFTVVKVDPKDRLHVEVADKTGAIVLREEVRRSPHGDGDWTVEHTFPLGEYTVTARTDSDRRYGGAFVAAETMPERRIVVPRQP